MLLAVTRSPLPWEGDLVARRMLDSWHVLAVVDDHLTRLSESPDTLQLSHSPFAALDQPDRDIGVLASVDGSSRRLALHRSLGADSSLYYTITPHGELICGTRVTALRRAGVVLEEDRRRLPEFFVYCLVCPPASLFRNVSLLTQDEDLTFEERDGAWRIAQRTIFELPGLRSVSATDFSAEAAAVLTEVMGLLGPLDARTAVLLSGGVDSSVLSRLALRQGYRHCTFGASYRFERPEADIEARYASSAAAGLGVRHEHYIPTIPRYLAGLIEAIAATETPLHGLQSVLLNCLFRDGIPDAARVIVIGDGADSVFGNATHKRVFDAGRPLPLERLVSNRVLLKMLWRSGTGVGGRLADAMGKRRDLMRSLDDPRHLIWADERFGSVDWTCSHFGVDARSCSLSRRDLLARYPDESIINRFLLLNILCEALQTMWGRLAHATGRAAYFPFRHASVLRAATSTPWSERVGPETKHQLRQAGRLLGVPEFILTRPKAYFGVAPDRWAGRGGVLEPLVKLAAPVVGEKTIRQVQVFDEGLSRIYWNLLNYAIWRRMFIDGESSASLIEELNDR